MAENDERLAGLERRVAALERPIPAGEMSKMESAIETRVSSSVHLKLENMVNSANWLAGRVHALEGRLDPIIANRAREQPGVNEYLVEMFEEGRLVVGAEPQTITFPAGTVLSVRLPGGMPLDAPVFSKKQPG